MRGKKASNEHVTLSLEEPGEPGMPKLYFDYKTTTNDVGSFVFERVVPGDGQVMRSAVRRMGAMSSWTPTHVTKATFVPGETTHVAIGRVGRQVAGRLVLADDVKAGNDWRLAMISVQSRPAGIPEPPKLPIPKVINPVEDRDAAMAWWNQWQHTAAGKRYVLEMKQYQEAMQGFESIQYSGRAEEDGRFVLEDMPTGDYQLTVQAFAKAQVGHGDLIATLTHSFQVPEADAAENGWASAQVELGDLTLKAIERRIPSR
jgi:hypothetical protein